MSTALTTNEAKAILAIENGCDVYAYDLAMTLRGIQRKGLPVGQMQGPKRYWRKPRARLFNITDPQAYAGDGTDQMPYFGAVATQDGIDAAQAVLAREVQS